MNESVTIHFLEAMISHCITGNIVGCVKYSQNSRFSMLEAS